MPATYHPEALKAQAVAAYTYYSYRREQNASKPDPALQEADFSGNLPQTFPAIYSPDGLKSQARPGMGTCQGRMCSAAVAEMIAHAHGLPIETLPPYHAQPPLFPLPLEELASMSIPPEGL